MSSENMTKTLLTNDDENFKMNAENEEGTEGKNFYAELKILATVPGHLCQSAHPGDATGGVVLKKQDTSEEEKMVFENESTFSNNDEQINDTDLSQCQQSVDSSAPLRRRMKVAGYWSKFFRYICGFVFVVIVLVAVSSLNLAVTSYTGWTHLDKTVHQNMTDIQKMLREMQDKLSESKESMVRVNQNIEDFSSKLHIMNVTITGDIVAISNKANEIEQLFSRMDRISATASQMNGTIAQLFSKMDSTNAAVVQNIEQLFAKMDLMNTTVAQKIDQLFSEMGTVTNTAVQTNENTERLFSQTDRMNATVTQMNVNIRQLFTKMDVMNTTVAQTKEQLFSVMDATAARTKEQLFSEMDAMNDTAAQINGNIEQLFSEIDRVNATAVKNMKQLLSEMGSMKNVAAQTNKSIGHLSFKIDVVNLTAAQNIEQIFSEINAASQSREWISSKMNSSTSYMNVSIEQLSSEVDAMKTTITQANKAIVQLSFQINITAVENMEQLFFRMDAMDATNLQMNASMEHLFSEMDMMKTTNKQTNKTIEWLSFRVDRMNVTAAHNMEQIFDEIDAIAMEMNASIEWLSSQMDAVTSTVAQMREGIVQIFSDLDMMSTANVEMNETIERVSLQMKAMNNTTAQNIDWISSEVDRMDSTTDKMNGNIKQLFSQMDAIDRKARQMNGSIEQLSFKVDRIITALIDDINVTLSGAYYQVSVLDDSIISMIDVISILNETLGNVIHEQTNMRRDLTQVDHELRRNVMVVNSLNVTSFHMHLFLKEKYIFLQSALSNLSKTLSEFNEQLLHVQVKSDHLESQLYRNSQVQNFTYSKLEDIQRRINETWNLLNSTTMRVSSMERSQNSLIMQHGDFRRNLSMILSSIGVIDDQLISFTNATNLLAMQLTKIHGAMFRISSDMREAQENISALQSHFRYMEVNISATKHDIAGIFAWSYEKEKIIGHLESQQNATQDNLNIIQSGLVNLREEVISLKGNMTHLKNLLMTVRLNISSGFQQIGRNVTSLQMRVSIVHTRNDMLRNNITSLTQKISTLKNSVLHVYMILTSVRNDVSIVQSNISSLSYRISTNGERNRFHVSTCYKDTTSCRVQRHVRNNYWYLCVTPFMSVNVTVSSN